MNATFCRLPIEWTQDDRDRQQRRRRHRAPVLDVRHRPQARPAREPDRDAEARCRRRPRSRSRGRCARGSARRASPNCEKSHRSLELDEDRREARELRRVEMHRVRCHAARIAIGTAISSRDLQRARCAAHVASSPLRRMPAQRAPLEQREAEVDRDAEEPGRERERVELRLEAVRLRVVDLLAEAGRAHEELGREGEDQRDRRRDAQAGRDVRHGARQLDAVEALEAADAERLRRLERDRDRRRGRRTSSGRAAARTRRTLRGRPRSSGSCRSSGRARG